MDITQAINVMQGYKYGLAKLDENLVNFYHVYNSTTSRIYFCYYRNTPTMMHTLTILWDDGITTTITLLDCDMYKVKYKDKFVRISDLEINNRGRFSWDEKKGTIIGKSMTIVSPCYLFTLSKRIEINRVLVKCKVPRLLKHTRLTSRISSKLVNPSLCLGMKHLL